MFYQGKYCCECGNKIERTDGNIFTSRKFCELCETDYKFEKLLMIGAGSLLLLFGFWGVSNVFLQSEAPLIVKEKTKAVTFKEDSKRSLRSDNLPIEEITENDSSNAVRESTGNSLSEQSLLSKSDSGKTKSAKVMQKSPAEDVYYCGAETKKGTPCSRHIRGGGRCWQHKEREAMLPDKDLLVREQ